MIHILASFEVKNDKLSDFIKLCNELIKESRAEEGMCFLSFAAKYRKGKPFGIC